MPLYNTATAATAINVTPKWLDNLLSHNKIDGLQGDTQGVARKLSLQSITIIALAKELIDALDLRAPAAIKLAAMFLDSAAGEVTISPQLHLRFDTAAFRAEVLARLSRAVEIAPSPRRGRPPKR